MSEATDRLMGAIAGHYTIERELGRGGMATVYLAIDVRHGRRVAIKVLEADLARSMGAQRFLQEIQIAARLNHPNILPLHDSGNAEGLLYYVMPCVDGESLRQRLVRERHLSLEDVVDIIRQVAAALGYAHTQGVIHRDIKPENILLAGTHVVVADFGIARAIDAAGTDRLTVTGLALGTPAYMSPEQAGADRGLDGRTDIYSLGCVAYEMLGGEPPFTGPSPQAVLARHAVDPIPPLRTLRPSVPRGVEQAITKALAKVATDRFTTAEEFAAAVRRASTTEAIATEARRLRHARRLRIAGGGVGAALLAPAIWWLANLTSGPNIHRFAVLPFAHPANDREHPYFVEGLHDALIAELARDGLGVIARTSVMQYRDTQKPVRMIARELGVDAVVEATLMRTPDSVTLHARLIDGRTEQYLWSDRYGAGVGQVSELPRNVARAIARTIQPAHAAQAKALAATPRPVHPEAHDAVLKGRFYVHEPGPAALDAALQYFELALTKDPNYAPAYAGISNVWGVRRQRGYLRSTEATARATAAALRALELDSTLAEPHYALATSKTWGEWDWEAGEREFRQAIRLKPDFPEARAFFAHLLYIRGRPREAMEQIERARQLDPLDPTLQALHGGVLSLARRHRDAIAQLRQAAPRSPQHAQWRLWLTLHDDGQFAEALSEAQKWARANDPEIGAALTHGYREGGYAGAMRAAAELQVARSRVRHVAAWNIALWYAAAGETDRTLDWLERAFEVRDPGMPYLGVHPAWDKVRSHPRYAVLLRRMRLAS